MDSLLVTDTMWGAVGAGSAVSLAVTPRVTATILWLAGQRTFGDATTLVSTGGVVSRTVTRKEPFAVLPARSTAEAATGLVPSANRLPEAGVRATGTSPLRASWAVA